MLNPSAYLARIDYRGPTEPSAEALLALHRVHMLAVPFENLDIHLGRPIFCDEAAFLHKIVNERRGGFCYELNGAFAVLLDALGFHVTLLSACVAGADGNYSPEFDHLTLRVDLPGVVGTAWLADVGFGDSFIEPLLLQPGLEQPQIGRVYRLVESESQSIAEIETVFYVEVRSATPENNSSIEKSRQEGKSRNEEKSPQEKWKRQYSFTLRPRQLADFAAMCRYHQTSPDSHFTRQRLCTRATPEGRITSSDLKLIETRNGSRIERKLSGDAEWRATLRELFRIDLPA
ncbi:MAG: arylamine N-acetyltransferase [Terriglobales bacterium]